MRNAPWLTLLGLLLPGAATAQTQPAPVPLYSERSPTILGAEQTVQIKLRDLIGLVPAGPGQADELLARLKAIEGQLIRIEQILAALLGGARVQTNPYPEPLGPPAAPLPVAKDAKR